MHDKRSLIALIVLLPLVALGSLSLYYSPLPGPLPTVVAMGFILASLAVFFFAGTWKKAVPPFAVFFALVLAVFLLKSPSNDRHWQADLALLPYATIEGNRVTIHNIRNCDYRTETDFTVHYYDKSFDLDTLTSVDLYQMATSFMS